MRVAHGLRLDPAREQSYGPSFPARPPCLVLLDDHNEELDAIPLPELAAALLPYLKELDRE